MSTNKNIEKSRSVDRITHEEKIRLAQDLFGLSTLELERVIGIVIINEPIFGKKEIDLDSLKISTIRDVQNYIRVLNITQKSVINNSKNRPKKNRDKKIFDLAKRLHNNRTTLMKVSQKTFLKSK